MRCGPSATCATCWVARTCTRRSSAAATRSTNRSTLAQQLGIDDIVEFTGRVPDEFVQRCLSTADVCLSPDPLNPLNDVSTMNKVVEYMAMEPPARLVRPQRGAVSAGEAAAYAPANDEAAFAASIDHLLRDADLREAMGSIGRQTGGDTPVVGQFPARAGEFLRPVARWGGRVTLAQGRTMSLRGAAVCGIAGLRAYGESPVDVELAREMSRALCHRGPDEHGEWVSPSVALMHRRLSIIDVAGSAQPMSTPDRALPHHLQRRDPQLPRTQGPAGLPVRDRWRHRGRARHFRSLRHRGTETPPRSVRVRSLRLASSTSCGSFAIDSGSCPSSMSKNSGCSRLRVRDQGSASHAARWASDRHDRRCTATCGSARSPLPTRSSKGWSSCDRLRPSASSRQVRRSSSRYWSPPDPADVLGGGRQHRYGPGREAR